MEGVRVLVSQALAPREPTRMNAAQCPNQSQACIGDASRRSILATCDQRSSRLKKAGRKKPSRSLASGMRRSNATRPNS